MFATPLVVSRNTAVTMSFQLCGVRGSSCVRCRTAGCRVRLWLVVLWLCRNRTLVSYFLLGIVSWTQTLKLRQSLMIPILMDWMPAMQIAYRAMRCQSPPSQRVMCLSIRVHGF